MRKIFTVPARKLMNTLEKAPWKSFFVFVALLFGAIYLGHTLRAPEAEPEKSAIAPKQVAIFKVGEANTALKVPAQIKKDSTIRITALTPGIVSAIWTRPGQKVTAGSTLFTLTNDYGSGSSQIEKRIAENDARLAAEVAGIDKDIQALEPRRIKRDPELTETEEDIALENLKKEKEIRKTTLENSRLNLELALRNDAVLRPKSGFAGTITSIAVRPGQFVSAGETLATLSAVGQASTLEALLPSETAWLLDPTKPASLGINGQTFPLTPLYLATQENEIGLYSAVFSLPTEAAALLTNDRYTDISVMLQSREGRVLLPLDSIFQDNNRAWVMAEEDGLVRSKSVTLGNIFGNYAEVQEGIAPGTHVILSRGLIEGEAVKTE